MSRPAQVLRIDKDVEYTQTIAKSDTLVIGESDAVEVITVHHDAYLVGVTSSLNFGSTAHGDWMIAELSKSGNFQANISDNPDTLDVLSCRQVVVTQGGGNLTVNKSFRTKIFFRAGEKLYFNTDASHAVAYEYTAVLYWQAAFP